MAAPNMCWKWAGAADALGLGFALRRPRQSLRALRLALDCGARGAGGGPGTGGRLRHLIYWLEAACMSPGAAARLRLPHIHAHFGTNSATVAMLAAEIGGLRYSFTAHGPEEFDAPHALFAGRKDRGRPLWWRSPPSAAAQLCRWAAIGALGGCMSCALRDRALALSRTPAPPTGAPRLVAIGRLAEQKGFPC
jgi:colanic acid/amylovoran biosynthesis glycosyltransferase